MSLAVKHDDGAAVRRHVPVMVAEVRDLVAAHGPRVVVDVTLGMAGHAEAILGATDARIVGIDRDADALAAASERLAPSVIGCSSARLISAILRGCWTSADSSEWTRSSPTSGCRALR